MIGGLIHRIVRNREADVLAMIGPMVFVGALIASCTVIAMMVAPQWQRILALASGKPEAQFAPLTQLALAERRIAVRRWAARPMPAAVSRLREAA